MVRPSNNNSGNISSDTVLRAACAGVLIGLAWFILKLAVSGLALDINFLLSLLTQPSAYIAGLLGISGFLLFQKSLHDGKVSVVSPIVTGLSIAVPVSLAFLFLSETISTLKIVGIGLILIGIAGLRD